MQDFPMTHPNSEVPELAGWRLVPIEPDDAQVEAGLQSLAESTGEPILHIVRDALFAYRAMVRTAPTPPLPESAVGEMDEMRKISALIADLQDIHDRFGDTCVYIRRGGLSWGAVALNWRDDDKQNGVFDLQAQHDRDMGERLKQVERLIAERNKWRERAWQAESAALHPEDSQP
jgi:hypothetical protein